jgi:hypothetical protein
MSEAETRGLREFCLANRIRRVWRFGKTPGQDATIVFVAFEEGVSDPSAELRRLEDNLGELLGGGVFLRLGD